MIVIHRLVLIALVFTAGCHRSASVAPPAATDYRKLSQAELVALIKDRLRVESVALSADGQNRFKGTLPSPDGTIPLPIEVTVEAERIVIVSTGGGLTTRQIITPQGLKSDLK